MKGFFILVFDVLCIIAYPGAMAQSVQGKIHLDSTWTRKAYLSHVQRFSDMYSMNYDIIIGEALIDPSGAFRFDENLFEEDDQLYRLHFIKKNDPPATLIIGGLEENHIFFIANKNQEVIISGDDQDQPVKSLFLKGYYPNDLIRQTDVLISLADTLNYSALENDFIQEVLYEKLRYIADTTQNNLASLYALSRTNIEQNASLNEDYYKRLFKKWDGYNSLYYEEIKRKAAVQTSSKIQSYIIPILLSFCCGIALYHLLLVLKQRGQKNLIKTLSRQEIKIYQLLKEGKSNKEIASEAHIEVSTVKSHINNIYSKLNISSRKDIYNINI